VIVGRGLLTMMPSQVAGGRSRSWCVIVGRALAPPHHDR
jgi:hypothetical protein